MRVAIALGLIAGVATSPAAALNTLQRKSLSLRVGGFASIGTFAQHKRDCTPLGGATINVTHPPALGRIALTENAPTVATWSITGSCIGTRQRGTRVDYFPTSAGVDTFEFDVVFMNGSVHYVVTAKNH